LLTKKRQNFLFLLINFANQNTKKIASSAETVILVEQFDLSELIAA